MRFLIALLGIVLLGAAVIGAAFLHALTSADPYRGFMRNYEDQLKGSRPAHQEAARPFAAFVAETFPIGSDAKSAIAEATRGGFQLTKSDSDSVELLWRRHAGPCGQLYFIVIDRNADGTIAKTTGRIHWICL
jgi:hypothetical protein